LNEEERERWEDEGGGRRWRGGLYMYV